MEGLAVEFHDDVRFAYKTLAEFDETGRWVVIDANRPAETVQFDVWRVVQDRLIRSRFIERPGLDRERET